jgi:hypothetical protein
MALSGFIVSMRESLLYRPYRPPGTRRESGLGAAFVSRTVPHGAPVFPPGFGMKLVDPNLTEEEIDIGTDKHACGRGSA